MDAVASMTTVFADAWWNVYGLLRWHSENSESEERLTPDGSPS